MSIFVYILLAVILVEGLTELLCKSLIFSSTRVWLAQSNSFIKDVIACGYCTSVWMSMVPAVLISFHLFSGVILPLIASIPATVILHRLSNYLHNFNDKYLDKFYTIKK